MGSRGVYHEGWFAGTLGSRAPWSTDVSGVIDWEPERETWELYNLEVDYSQATDLAKENPRKLAELKTVFDQEARAKHVCPIGASYYTSLFSPTEMPSSTLTQWTFYAGQGRTTEAVGPKFISGLSSLAVIDTKIAKDAEGVLFALGNICSGFTVYLERGFLKAEYNAMTMNRFKVCSHSAIPIGKVRIEVETKCESKEGMAPATLTLRGNGKQVAQGRMERSVPSIHTASETFGVGKDLGSPVALDCYERAPFAFNGAIEKIDIKYIN